MVSAAGVQGREYKLKGNIESSTSQFSFKRWPKARSTRGQPAPPCRGISGGRGGGGGGGCVVAGDITWDVQRHGGMQRGAAVRE